MPGYGASGAGPSPAGSAANQSLLDGILRRKTIVVVLGLVGLLLGYLYYTQQENVYQSTMALMVWNQSPPRGMDGDYVQQKVSTEKHLNLFTSQIVLRKAIEMEDGALKKLPSLSAVASPVDYLRSHLKAQGTGEKDDTLIVSMTGKHPEDLPMILNSVATAYETVLAEDSASVGKESIELLEELRTRLMNEKQQAEDRRLVLMNAGVSTNLPDGEGTEAVGQIGFDEDGNVINPHAKRLAELKLQRQTLTQELRDIKETLSLLEQAAQDPTKEAFQLAAIEARQALDAYQERFRPDINVNNRNDQGLRRLEQAEERIYEVETQLAQLQLRRKNLLRTYGEKHRVIVELDGNIDLWESTLTELKQDRQTLVAEVEAAEAKEAAEEAGLASVEDTKRKDDQKWIQLYDADLKTKQAQKLALLDEVVNEYRLVEAAANISAKTVSELGILNKQIEEKREAIRMAMDQLAGMNLVNTNYDVTRVSKINEPGIGYKIAPSLPKSLGLGALLGALVGCGLAILIDRSDMTYRSPTEIFERLKVPVISKVPPIKLARRQKDGEMSPAMVAIHRPTATASEAIRAARTAIFFAAQQDGSRVFLLTSPSPGDGKSTVTANLAISIAQAGKTVCLVDADLRRPRIHTYFGDAIDPGMMQVLAGTMELDDAFRTSDVEKLSRLTAGGRPKNPGEVVTSREFADLLDTLREQFDFVLIDSPPLLPVSDAAAISSLVDGVYLVMRIRKGVVLTSTKAKEKLDMVNANLMGVIVNGVDDNPHYNEYGSYAYDYGYGMGSQYGRYYEARNSRYQEKIASVD